MMTNDNSKKKPSRNQRLLKLYQRRGPFGSNTKGATIRRATYAKDLKKAYSLVHDMFVENNYIEPLASGMRLRVWETSSNTATFIAEKNEEVVGVQSLILDSHDAGIPSDESFKADLDAIRGENVLIGEAANEAVDKELRQSAVSTELMRTIFAQAWQTGCTHIVTAVSEKHRSFYDFIGFEQLGNTRSFTKEIDDPVILMCWDLKSQKNRWQSTTLEGDTMDAFWFKYCILDNQFIPQIEYWNVMAKRTFASPDQMVALYG
jgi:N-acyl amino acid synthase FeeM